MQVIAMTREMGSLGKDIAAGIAAKQGRQVVYHELIDQAADKMRVRKSHVVRLLESGADLWQQLRPERTSLSIFTADETFRLVTAGTAAVIRGWGAVHLLAPVQHVVRVRVCAPLDLRVERMMKRVSRGDRDAVRREMEAAEEAHTAIVRRHFGLNWRDAEHYDLVLSTERLGVDECIEEIERAMTMPRFQPTEASRRVLRALALEWSVRAALRRDARTARPVLRVECDEGVVRVGGCVDTAETAHAVVEAIGRVPGVRAVTSELNDISPARWARAQV